MELENQDRIVIWRSKHGQLDVWSDGEQFFVTAHAGIAWETFVTVGYSSPNYGLRGPGAYLERGFRHFKTGEVLNYEAALAYIAKRIEDGYNGIEWIEGNVQQNLTNFLTLAEIANKAYNEVTA